MPVGSTANMNTNRHVKFTFKLCRISVTKNMHYTLENIVEVIGKSSGQLLR